MSRIMNILEKCNLVEKANVQGPKQINLEEKNNIQWEEEIIDESNISIVKTSYSEENIKVPKIDSFEENLEKEINIEYDKKMMINEIYSLYEIENNSVNTVYMLQNLINALPQNLPKDVLKQSVINIINASNMDLNELLSDGELRLEVLGKVMEGYHNQTINRISGYKEEIAKLTSLINECEEKIVMQSNMVEEQVYLIKCETQKIDGIIDFFPK